MFYGAQINAGVTRIRIRWNYRIITKFGNGNSEMPFVNFLLFMQRI